MSKPDFDPSRRRFLIGTGAFIGATGTLGLEGIAKLLSPATLEKQPSPEQVEGNFDKLGISEFLPYYHELMTFQSQFGFIPQFPPFQQSLTLMLQFAADGRYLNKKGKIKTDSKEAQAFGQAVEYFRDGWFEDQTVPRNDPEYPFKQWERAMNLASGQQGERTKAVSVYTQDAHGNLHPANPDITLKMHTFYQTVFDILPGVGLCLPQDIILLNTHLTGDYLGYYQDGDKPQLAFDRYTDQLSEIMFYRRGTHILNSDVEEAVMVNLHEMRHAVNDRWHYPENKKFMSKQRTLEYMTTVLQETRHIMDRFAQSPWVLSRSLFNGGSIDQMSTHDINDVKKFEAHLQGLGIMIPHSNPALYGDVEVTDEHDGTYGFERVAFAVLTRLQHLTGETKRLLLADKVVNQILQTFVGDVTHILVDAPLTQDYRVSDDTRHPQLTPSNLINRSLEIVNDAYLNAFVRPDIYVNALTQSGIDMQTQIRQELGIGA